MDEWIKKAKSYSSAKRLLFLASVAVNAGFFLAMIRTGASAVLARACYGFFADSYMAAVMFITLTGCALAAVSAPFTCVIPYTIERGYGLSRQAFLSWVVDCAKSALLSAALIMAMFTAVYFLLINFTLFWWLYAGIVFFLVNIFLARVFPMLIIPLFYKLTKVSDPGLKDKLSQLARKAGIKILDIYVIALGKKTSKANAAVCGMGTTKRILLSDTILEKYPADEIEMTLAHELAHYKLKHIWKLSLAGFLMTLTSLFLIDIMLNTLIRTGVIQYKYSLEAFPYMALFLTLFNFMAMPVENFITRIYEAQADKNAIALTNNPGALLKLMERLSSQNLSDPSPCRFEKIFFYSHPPAAERIAAAKNYQAV
ncbi:MAG: M48 family metallopeptidase [Candidatus Omnitrophica bacterium]|nr:M48 family metallopeptidase [Candidatus Omnitrophota bacterium]